VVGAASVLVGIAGLIFHLESSFFVEQTLQNLVYTAPFAAPLAYTGLGLLLILDRLLDPQGEEWARWVVLLALGGFVGNFALSLADHAQNGFFDAREWIPVVSSAFAVGALTVAFGWPRERTARVLAKWAMLAQIPVGLAGFYVHLVATLAGPMDSLWENVVYGAPVFAPLLFADLAALGLLAVWALQRAAASGPPEG
jgi:hypothetical protein